MLDQLISSYAKYQGIADISPLIAQTKDDCYSLVIQQKICTLKAVKIGNKDYVHGLIVLDYLTQKSDLYHACNLICEALRLRTHAFINLYTDEQKRLTALCFYQNLNTCSTEEFINTLLSVQYLIEYLSARKDSDKSFKFLCEDENFNFAHYLSQAHIDQEKLLYNFNCLKLFDQVVMFNFNARDRSIKLCSLALSNKCYSAYFSLIQGNLNMAKTAFNIDGDALFIDSYVSFADLEQDLLIKRLAEHIKAVQLVQSDYEQFLQNLKQQREDELLHSLTNYMAV